eukprot:2964533-Amphidinium_carterae.1
MEALAMELMHIGAWMLPLSFFAIHRVVQYSTLGLRSAHVEPGSLDQTHQVFEQNEEPESCG